MNKEKLQKLMKEVDKTNKPKHWKKFINENTINHNVILKCGHRAFCTHCQKYFDKEVNVHTFQKEKCKWCGNEYYVRNCNIKNCTFLKDIAFLAKASGTIIVRIFEIESKYDYKTKKFEQNLQEFARFIPNVGLAINNSVSFFMWNQKVWHNTKIKNWHIYTGIRVLNDMPIYPYDYQQIFKDTLFQYAPIEEFKKEYKSYNDFEILEMASLESFELLWKMGLHRLSLNAKDFNKKGSFAKRFGVPKSFLKFMAENDIDYEEYKILKLLQETNKELINKYRMYDYDYLAFMHEQGLLKQPDIVKRFYHNFSLLKVICKYVPLKNFLEYQKGVKNIHIYADYLEIANKIGFSIKSRKRLFPYQLKAWHDKLSNKLEIMDDMNTQFAVYLRYLELSKYTYEDDKYIIFPAPSVDSIKDEGQQQGNCVATTYLQPYLEKKTEIYFIRNLKETTKSFITLEYNENRVRQKELPHHSINFTKEQLAFIEKWTGFRQFLENKEKYQKKTNTNNNIIKYKLVA